jgi:hypothetical protein
MITIKLESVKIDKIIENNFQKYPGARQFIGIGCQRIVNHRIH